MPEQNTPQGASAAERAEAASRTKNAIDAANEAVMSEADDAEEAPEPKAETKPRPAVAVNPEDDDGEETEETEEREAQDSDDDEATTTGDTPATEKPGAKGKSKSDPANPAKGPEDHPFTPEDETLLRRTNATVEDVEYFRALTPEQRSRALAPARNAVRNADRLAGMSPEERGRAAEKDRSGSTSTSGPGQDATHASGAIPKLAADNPKVIALAEKLGSTPEAVLELAGLILEPIAASESQRAQRSREAADHDWNRSVAAAAESSHAELSKSFPRLKERAVFEALMAEPETFALFEAKVRTGVDVGKAMLDAARERATVKFLPEITKRNQEARASDRTRAVHRTAEPTSRTGKRPAAAPKAPRSVDEAHEAVMAERE